jgi:hypothetical protein
MLVFRQSSPGFRYTINLEILQIIPKVLFSCSLGGIKLEASGLIDDYIASLNDWRGTTIANIRKVVHSADPEIVEEWKWRGTPVWSHDGIVCLAKAFKEKVKLTFYDGALLPDPDKIFNSELEGNQWRAIDIYKDDKINDTLLRALVMAAVEHNHEKVKPAVKPGGTRSSLRKKPAK